MSPGLDAASARRNLRRESARLRETGAGELPVSQVERLSLHPSVVLHTQRFAEGSAAAHHDAALALALWRGPVADGLLLPDAPAFEDALAGARTRLARQRMAALEASAAACEARGDGAAALRATETLLAEDPSQQIQQHTAMRLRAVAGRRAAALASYERFASLLAGELGLAPMADTVALVRTLRQAEAPPVTPAPTARRLPVPAAAAQPAAWRGPALLPFVGREDELTQLADAWQEGLALDLATDVGDFTLAERWVASLLEAALMDTQFRNKQAFNLVHLALARGDLCAAAAELLALGDVAALPQPCDRSHAGLRHAELCLACGDASGALVWLDRGQAEAALIEARALVQAARVPALRQLHGDGHVDTRQARAGAQALLAGAAAVPVLAALAMRQACGVDQRDAVLRLAIGLEYRPAARARFVARWAAAWQR